MAFNAEKLLPIMILSSILTAYFSSGRVTTAGTATDSVDLTQARSDLARAQEKQKAVEARVTEVHADEERLGKMVQELKQNRSGLTEALQELRLERALQQLRDRLLELQQLRREQEELKSVEEKVRDKIRNALRHQADDRLREAERLFKAGREKDADAQYQQAFGLMEEYQHMSETTIPPIVADTPTFDPEITDREGSAELIEIAVLLRHEAEEAQQELKRLDQIAQRISSDLAIEKRMLRFQGIRERGSDLGTGLDKAMAGRGIEMERELADIQKRIKEKRERIEHLLRRAEELEKIAEEKNRLLERNKK